MNHRILLEAFGYIGSAVVVISMTMTSALKLRLVNILGSAVSAAYAAIVGAYPVALLNCILIAVNAAKIVQFFMVKKSYTMIESKGSAGLAQYIAQKYKDDILNFFPDFKGIGDDDSVFILMNQDAAAGITAGKIDSQNTFNIIVDYVTPTYRDSAAGKYLFEQIALRGCKKAVLETRARQHEQYLYKIGFKKISRGKYVKDLAAP